MLELGELAMKCNHWEQLREIFEVPSSLLPPANFEEERATFDHLMV